MPKMSDQEYLMSEQYRDASNLAARMQLHSHFSVNVYGWHQWVFDQLDLPPQSRILELGCGPAWLWRDNLDRIPEGWDITLSDFSPGMLRQAQSNLRDSQGCFDYSEIDAQSIPHEDALIITEAEPLVAYILSSADKKILVGEKLAALRRCVEEEIDLHGHIHVTKDSGIFEAVRDDGSNPPAGSYPELVVSQEEPN